MTGCIVATTVPELVIILLRAGGFGRTAGSERLGRGLRGNARMEPCGIRTVARRQRNRSFFVQKHAIPPRAS